MESLPSIWWIISFGVTVFGVIIGLLRLKSTKKVEKKVDKLEKKVDD